MPEGHVALHEGMAVKTCVPPEDMVTLTGFTATEFKVMTVSERVVLAALPAESFKKTRTVKVPGAVGMHDRAATLEVTHPPGRPVYL
jgi:hypothetical protein